MSRTSRSPALGRARGLSPTIRPIAPALGAEIGNVDLRAVLDEADVAEIRKLLLQYKVLVFRDQRLSPAEHVAFARHFGPLEAPPVNPTHPDFPELVSFNSGPEREATENLWHADMTFREKPPMGAVLRCVELPDNGGDTIWVNMAMAYQRLPESVKETIEGLHAVHDMMPNFSYRIAPEELAAKRAENPPSAHPIVIRHPETGERVLYVNVGFTTHICDYRNKYPTTNGASYKLGAAKLLITLMEQVQIPELQMRLRWEKDTMVFWDNRCTQHYAVSDYFPKVRRMMRATISGERPVAAWS